jgi:ubiquitin-conjugating enzyme E2 S
VFRQTIKCLLIVPNPESALNEEAGKLLLEQYDDYCRRARMMTEIHAAPVKRVQDKSNKTNQSSSTDATGLSAQSSSGSATTSASSSNVGSSVASKKAKVKVLSRDRRRTLKRL